MREARFYNWLVMRRLLITLLSLHFFWSVVGTPFGIRFQQPTDFYSEDIAQEQLRSAPDNQLDDHIEASLTQHGLMDDLPDMPALPQRTLQAIKVSVMPAGMIRYTPTRYSPPLLASPERPPHQAELHG